MSDALIEEGVSGSEDSSSKVVGMGNGMAVASDTAEKSGQGLDDGGTGRFGFSERSGRRI